MAEIKDTKIPHKTKKTQDEIKRILDKYDFTPDFIPSTKSLYSKKSKLFRQKSMKQKLN